MGGLLVREAVQVTYPALQQHAADHINKIVTLGTPHQGISFQFLQDWIKVDAEEELEHFNPRFQADEDAGNRKGKYKDRKNEAAFVLLQGPLPSRPAADGGRHQLPELLGGRFVVAESAVFGGRRRRADLQPQRWPGEADVCADPRRASDLRPQMPRRPRLAGDEPRGVRDRHPLLLRRHRARGSAC